MIDPDDLPDGVLVADRPGTVTLLNRAGGRLLGTDPAAARGRPLAEVLPLADPQGRDWWGCLDPFGGLATRTGSPERLLALTRADRPPRDLLVTARFVRDRPGTPVTRLVVGFRDAATRERQERDRAELVSTVSHELRSPLTSVKGFTATLLAKWDRFTDEQKKVMLATVDADADRVTRLINELLDVSRIDAGRIEVRRQVVDLPALARRVLDGRVAAGDEPGRFALDVDGPLPTLWADPDKVTQIVSNLVDNAVRHGRGPVRVSVRGRDHPPGTLLAVSDEGDGVPADVAPRLFARFWRGRRGGTGLGLYIARGLAEAHGGTVRLEPAAGGGATFTLELPPGTPEFARSP